MAIKKVTVENFKGIAAAQTFEIKPITIFIGGNSSGKSSALHAITALAQTLKLGNSAPSLVLDDDYAHVHLGRFAEISHSHKYSDPIGIGIEGGTTSFTLRAKETGKSQLFTGQTKAHYNFKSTLRTQEVYVDDAAISVAGRSISIKRGSKKPYSFSAIDDSTKIKFPVDRLTNFLFRTNPSAMVGNPDIWVPTYLLLENAQKTIEKELRNTLYLGPFRQSPLRRYPHRGSFAVEVGPQGDATITMLASEFIQAQDRPHLKQINAWLSHLGLAKNVDLARVGTSDLFDVKLTLPDGGKLPIADLGYGLSQVLPVLTQCSFAPEDATLLFEQPELHLHENAAKKLAKVFIDTVKQKNASIIIESHSPDLIYELFNSVKSGSLTVDDIALYTVERKSGASQYTRVNIELEDGTIEVDHPWAKGVAG